MVSRIGAWAIERFGNFLYAMGFSWAVVKECLFFFKRRQVGFKVLVMQILFTGVEALAICAVLAVAIGAAINIVGASFLPSFGQSKLQYTLLIAIITRELGPLLTAIIIIARSGTAIATELGTMVVSHEVEAYVSFGVDPLSYLVVPRVVGVTVSMVVLGIYFNIFGLLGSFLVVELVKPIPFSEYMSNVFAAFKADDLFIGLFKSFAFGIIISLVSTYQGFSVSRASTEIPGAGIRAVGQSIVLCILADALLTLASYVG